MTTKVHNRVVAGSEINVLDLGADPTGAVDSTARVQAAIDAAPEGGSVYFPAGTYLLATATSSRVLLITKRITLRGDGWGSVLKVGAALGVTDDVIVVRPPTSLPVQGVRIENLAIQPQSGTPARHAICLDATNSDVSNLVVSHVLVEELGGYALTTINAGASINGCPYASRVQDCVLQGGLKFDVCGDSVVIEGNVIRGSRDLNLSTVDGLYDGGAHGLRVVGNNITTAGGVVIGNAWQGLFAYNNCESVVASTNAHSAMIDIQGNATHPVETFKVVGNYLGSNSLYVTDCVRVDYAKATVFRDNYVGRGSGVSYRITSHADRTAIIGDWHIPNGEALTTYLDDLGSNTYIEYVDPATGYRRATGHAWTTNTGTVNWLTAGVNLKGGANAVLGWGSASPDSVANDVSISRLAANILGVGNGTALDTTGIFVAGSFRVGTGGGPRILTGTGAPATPALDAEPLGSLYLRQDGGASTSLYVKTGAGNTWTAK